MKPPLPCREFITAFHDAGIAHVLALTECGTIPADEMRRLLSALIELRDADPLPSGVCLERSLDALVEERTGTAARWLYGDRTRQEALAIAFQLTVRERIVDFARRHLALAEVMVAMAQRNRDVAIPQRTSFGTPLVTTLGNTLLTFVYPMFRDLERLQHCFRAFNSSPAGLGSQPEAEAASSLNRDRLRALLGFDEIRPNTRDALWQADSPIELMAAIVALMVNLNRLAEDLRKWHPDASTIGADVSWIRSRTAELLAKVPTLAALGKDSANDADGGLFAAMEFSSAFDSAIRATELLGRLISQTASIRTDTALEAAPVQPERILEMIAECRARLVRENFWITSVTQRIERSRSELIAQAGAKASE